MKVPRSLVGKTVEITWRDPHDWKEEAESVDTTKGAAHVPQWTHQGVIEDVTEGWVRLRYGVCDSPYTKPTKEGVMVYEDLIETLVVLAPSAPVTPS